MTPYFQEAGLTLWQGDCLEVLPTLPSDSVDLVLTDPPWNVGMRYADHFDRMAPDAYSVWLRAILAECARVSRDGVVWTPGNINLFAVPALLAGTGLEVARVLGWHRLEYAGDVWAGGPATCWEAVVWASKQPKPYCRTIYGAWGRDFLLVPATRGNPYKAVHPCPKPDAVVRWLLGLFCPDGGTVLDPFAGSLTTLQLARELGYRAIGIELGDAYCAAGLRRLEQGVLPLAGGE